MARFLTAAFLGAFGAMSVALAISLYAPMDKLDRAVLAYFLVPVLWAAAVFATYLIDRLAISTSVLGCLSAIGITYTLMTVL